MKLIFASPTYGPTEPQANRSHRIAIMHAAKRGHEWLGDSSPDKQPYAAARNNIVQSVIHDDAYPDDAAIFWCDSDVILPDYAVSQLASHGEDFVTGVYFQRHPPHWPLIANFREGGGKDKRGSFQWLVKWPENVLAPIDGCGFGCLLTSLGMLRKLEAPWFEFLKFSEDFDFCLKAKRAGYQLYVDTAVLCGHLMDPAPATFDAFKLVHPEFYLEEDHGTVRSCPTQGDLVPAEDAGQKLSRQPVSSSPAA